MTDKLAYRIPEASDVSGIGRTKLYEEISSGRLESISVGRRRLIPADALEAYLNRLREEQRRP